MRILHVTKSFHPETFGGIETVIAILRDGARAAGHVADVLTTAPGGDLGSGLDGDGVWRARRDAAPWSTPVSADLLRRGPAILRGYDVVHHHFPWPMGDLVQFLAGTAVPYVVTYHADIVRQRRLARLYGPTVMRRFLGGASRVVATSGTYARTSPVLSRLARAPEVVPLGLPPAPPPAPAQALSAPVAALLADPEPFFLFVGVLRYYKGLEHLVRAASAVRSRVVIAGDGPEFPALARLAGRVGAANVAFAGRVTEAEKWALLRRARALVLPSHLRAEAFGLSLLEASAAARPLVSCEIGTGTSEVNLDGRTGFVVPPGRPDELARAMRRLEDDPDGAAAMGREAARRQAGPFSARLMVERYLGIYEESRGGRPARGARASASRRQ